MRPAERFVTSTTVGIPQILTSSINRPRRCTHLP
jgi:hypothetical protein